MHFGCCARYLPCLIGACSLISGRSFAQPNNSSAAEAASPPIVHTVSPAHAVETQIPDNVLAWDSLVKEYTAKTNETEAVFTFSVTNISTSVVVIDSVTTSCGCTVAKLPLSPWILQPGSDGKLEAILDLAGKTGRLTKTVTIHSDKGERTVLIRASVGDIAHRVTGVPIPFMGTRERNQQLAKSDRQSVFHGDCAKCHAEPALGKSGASLYAAVCGICHNAEHRADSVPDLHHIESETNPEFWKRAIVQGKADSMMPAFAVDEGGPLNGDQVNSLIEFLGKNYGKQNLPGPEKQ
jgi:hypothetical protein